MPTFPAIPQSPYEATLIPASFRSVPFAVLDIAIKAGRRLEVHEYPFRDTPWTEDLGRRARRIAFSAFVIGDDVDFQAAQLLNACEARGPGMLVHPAYGSALWVVEDCETIERWDKGRYVEFKLAFVEPGLILYPTNGADTQAGTQMAADNAGTAAQDDFANAAAKAVQSGVTT
jgi:prophage DNA circulation protein